MDEDGRGAKHDRDVAAKVPAFDIFEVRTQSRGEIAARFRRPALSANLGKAGEPGLDRVPVPIAIVDGPKQRVFGAGPKRRPTNSQPGIA